MGRHAEARLSRSSERPCSAVRACSASTAAHLANGASALLAEVVSPSLSNGQDEELNRDEWLGHFQPSAVQPQL